MLEDLIMAATNEALRKMADEAVQQSNVARLTGGWEWAEDFPF